jgi:transposase InsO family protein
MVAFIDDHREEYGVEPICAVLPIALSTYYAHRARGADPRLRPAHARRDEALGPEIQRVSKEHFQVYGVRKVWCQLNREGHTVARCTVARLMQNLGLRGVLCGRGFTVRRRSRHTRPIARWTLYGATSRQSGRTGSGSATSRTWRPGAATSTWPS